jgi:desulfoferrodoxin (superoxide reductase-like protein)
MEPTIKPTVGRIVHFYEAPGAEPEAAIVIKVWSDTCVNLIKCNEHGTWTSKSSSVLMTPGHVGSGWSWPARV